MSRSYGYVAYIDEAGDDGIGKFRKVGEGGQSHWLVLSAMLISRENELNLVQWRDEISAAFPKKSRRDIHFKDLDHGQRVHACLTLGQKPVGIVSVLSNKTTIAGKPSFEAICTQQKNILYKYLLRYLLERITKAVAQAHEIRPNTIPMLKIVFSRRGGMDYRSFAEYLAYLKNLQGTKGSYFPIRWNFLSDDLIVAEDHSKVAGLQLADVAASAFYQAVELNTYGHTEPRYALALRERVIRHGPKKPRLNCGVTPVPNLGRMNLTLDQSTFFELWKASG